MKQSDRTIRNIINNFELENEEENYCKQIRVDNFYSNNYIVYRSNGDRNKRLSVDEYSVNK